MAHSRTFQIARLAFSLAVGAILSACNTWVEPNKYQHAQKSTALLQSEHGWGSGFAVQRVNPNGHQRIFLFTAAHVVVHCNTVRVHQVIRNENHKAGETIFTAVVIARDEGSDLALLWLDAPVGYFEPVVFDRHDVLPVGSPVYHCGNFLGPTFDGSVSTGVVSQLGAHPSDGWLWPIPLDQTTSMVLPGSSGGPLFCGADNAVCGVVVGLGADRVGFFVPLRQIKLFAAGNHVEFSVRGQRCPSDETLIALAKKCHIAPKAPEQPDPNKPIDE